MGKQARNPHPLEWAFRSCNRRVGTISRERMPSLRLSTRQLRTVPISSCDQVTLLCQLRFIVSAAPFRRRLSAATSSFPAASSPDAPLGEALRVPLHSVSLKRLRPLLPAIHPPAVPSPRLTPPRCHLSTYLPPAHPLAPQWVPDLVLRSGAAGHRSARHDRRRQANDL